MRGRRERALAAPFPSENNLGATIRAWRHFRKMTVTDLAIAAGFGKNGRGYISKIEHNLIKRLGEESLIAIARALNLAQSDLHQRRLPDMQEDVRPDKGMLDEAIAGCQAWLRVYGQDDRRLDCARTYLNLAQLYWERTALTEGRHERGTLLSGALEHIRQALPLFRERAPNSYQEAQQMRSTIEKAIRLADLEDAIAGCHALLRMYSQQTRSLDWARTHTRLAQLYWDRLSSTDQAEERRNFILKALQSLDLALPIFEKDASISYVEMQQMRMDLVAAREATRE